MKTITLTNREHVVLVATLKMACWIQANARGHCIGHVKNPDYVLGVDTEMPPREGGYPTGPTADEMSSLLERVSAPETTTMISEDWVCDRCGRTRAEHALVKVPAYPDHPAIRACISKNGYAYGYLLRSTYEAYHEKEASE